MQKIKQWYYDHHQSIWVSVMFVAFLAYPAVLKILLSLIP